MLSSSILAYEVVLALLRAKALIVVSTQLEELGVVSLAIHLAIADGVVA